MRIIAVFGLVLAAIGSAAALADEPMTALQLLESYEKTIQQMDGFRVEVVAKRFVTGDVPAGFKSAKDGHIGTTRYSVVHHGARWKVRRVILPGFSNRAAQYDLAKGTEYLRDSALGTDQAVQLHWISRQSEEPFQNDFAGQMMLMGVPRGDEWVLRYLRESAVPFGYLPGDDWHKLWTVMREARVLDLLPDMDVIAGHKTHVVTSRGQYGSHKLWLDPEFGYLPRQIEVFKQGGDLFEAVQIGVEQSSLDNTRLVNGNQIRQTRPSYTMTESRVRVENMQLEKIQGRFLTTAFDHIHDQTMKYADRTEKSQYRIEYRTQTVDCNPDSWPVEVFRFGVEVRDGTTVPSVEDKERRAVWKNGRIEDAGG